MSMARPLTDLVNDLRTMNPLDFDEMVIDNAADVLDMLARHLPQPACDVCDGSKQCWNDPATDPLRRHFHIDCPSPHCDDGRLAWDEWLRRIGVILDDQSDDYRDMRRQVGRQS